MSIILFAYFISHCQTLCAPIVCCELGNLYNKDAVLEALLEKRLQSSLSHIRGMKDLKTLQLTIANASDKHDELSPLFVCPVTKIPFSGMQPFFVVWTTGWVISEKAIKELGIDALQVEYGPFGQADLVRLVPQEAELDAARAAMHDRRSRAKVSKKRSLPSSTTDLAEDVVNARAEEEEVVAAGAASRPRLAGTRRVLEEAGKRIKEQEQSTVYKSLFHKDGEKDRTGNDLFMTVAGIRYTLG